MRSFASSLSLLPLTLLLIGAAACLSAAPMEKTLILPGGLPLRLVLIPEGTYQSGSEANEAGRDPDEGPRHEVTLTP